MRGMHGWQWLFLLEALPTIILGIATFFILPGFPSTSKGKKSSVYAKDNLIQLIGNSSLSFK